MINKSHCDFLCSEFLCILKLIKPIRVIYKGDLYRNASLTACASMSLLLFNLNKSKNDFHSLVITTFIIITFLLI